MLFIAIGLVASLAGRSSEKQPKKQETAVPAP
jgi:hypothetical protein